MFHTELERDGPGLLLRDIAKADEQVEAVISVIDTAAPDIIILASIDWDAGGLAAQALAERLDFTHLFAARTNRGEASGMDINGDGYRGDAVDRIGHARFTGQGALAVLSRWPVTLTDDLSTTPWGDVGLGPPRAELASLPISTTAHWHLSVATPDGPLSILTWHATAPVFDGPDDRNGLRNHDEAQLWVDYLATLPDGPVIVAGFANLDIADGDGRPDALQRLLAHPRLIDPRPRSPGGVEAALTQGGINATQRGDPALDTADWRDTDGPGNLRVDYLLPSRDLDLVDAGLVWPTTDDPSHSVVQTASRHRLLWLDVTLPRPEGDQGVARAEIR